MKSKFQEEFDSIVKNYEDKISRLTTQIENISSKLDTGESLDFNVYSQELKISYWEDSEETEYMIKLPISSLGTIQKVFSLLEKEGLA